MCEPFRHSIADRLRKIRVLVVLTDEDGGDAVDAEVGGHERQTMSTGVNAHEPFMSGWPWSTRNAVSRQRQANHPDHDS